MEWRTLGAPASHHILNFLFYERRLAQGDAGATSPCPCKGNGEGQPLEKKAMPLRKDIEPLPNVKIPTQVEGKVIVRHLGWIASPGEERPEAKGAWRGGGR